MVSDIFNEFMDNILVLGPEEDTRAVDCRAGSTVWIKTQPKEWKEDFGNFSWSNYKQEIFNGGSDASNPTHR